MLSLILLLLMQDCTWRPISAQLAEDARKIQVQQPKITNTKFREWMQRQIKKAKTEHETCPAEEHEPPLVIRSCSLIDDNCKYVLMPTIEAYLTPRSWWWKR